MSPPLLDSESPLPTDKRVSLPDRRARWIQFADQTHKSRPLPVRSVTIQRQRQASRQHQGLKSRHGAISSHRSHLCSKAKVSGVMKLMSSRIAEILTNRRRGSDIDAVRCCGELRDALEESFP